MLYLNVSHLRRCSQTLNSALQQYQNAEPDSITQEVFQHAIVKGYELAQETSFKLIKKALKAYGHGSKQLESLVVKDLLRLAVTHDLMSTEEIKRWFKYRDNRNDTAHDYGVGFAEETLILIPDFLIDVNHLADVLDSKLGQEAPHAK